MNTLRTLEWLTAIFSKLERYAEAVECCDRAIDGYYAIGDDRKAQSLREQRETIPFAV